MRKRLFWIPAAILILAMALSGCAGLLLFGPSRETAGSAPGESQAEPVQAAPARREMAETVCLKLRELCGDAAYLRAAGGHEGVLAAAAGWGEASPDFSALCCRIDAGALAEKTMEEYLAGTGAALTDAGREAIRRSVTELVRNQVCAACGPDVLAASGICGWTETFRDPGCADEATAWIVPCTGDAEVCVYLTVSARDGIVTMTAHYMPLGGGGSLAQRVLDAVGAGSVEDLAMTEAYFG